MVPATVFLTGHTRAARVMVQRPDECVQPEASREVEEVRYVGIDIGKWKCGAAIMDPEGVIVDEFAFTNDTQGIENLASRLTPEDRVVMESTGSVWSTLYDRLDERHVPVVLANPLKTRAIVSARIKSDKVDARILTHLPGEQPGGRMPASRRGI